MNADFTATDLRPLFPRERAALLEVLSSLDDAEWQLPTACPGWTVHDLALHLLNDDLRYLAGKRDGYSSPHGPVVAPPYGRAEVTALVNELNQRWIDGARWMSPRQLMELLAQSGEELARYLETVEMGAIGMVVDWVGPEPAPVWVDVAREFTERWMHQQQIRDAAGRPPLYDRWAIYPVFDSFMLALPHALRAVEAPVGANVHLTIRGEAGCTWIVRRAEAGWEFGADRGVEPFAAVSLDQDDAWRLFTRGLSPGEVRGRAILQGNDAAIETLLGMITILA